MTNKTGKNWHWIVGLVIMLSIASFASLKSSQAKNNAYEAPRMLLVISLTPSVALPAGCLPFPIATLDQQERTPTPAQNKGEKVSQSPTITPYPITQVIDLSPDLPQRQKAILMVFRCNGKYEQYFVGPQVSIPDALQLEPGDRVIQSIPPAVLIGAKPTKEPTDVPTVANPYPPPETAMPTMNPYP